jgi:hypothetical protein
MGLLDGWMNGLLGNGRMGESMADARGQTDGKWGQAVPVPVTVLQGGRGLRGGGDSRSLGFREVSG